MVMVTSITSKMLRVSLPEKEWKCGFIVQRYKLFEIIVTFVKLVKTIQMKRFLLILGVFFAAVSTAHAQYDHPSFMGTVGVSYSPIFNVSTGGGQKERTFFNGFGLSWSNAHAVSRNKPFYVGYGLGVQYATHVQKEEGAKAVTQNLCLKAPVEALYRVETDFDLVIIPRLGVDINYYPLFRVVSTMEGSDKESILDMYSVEIEEHAHMNRVTAGLHVGARFQLDHFFVDLSYELPAVGLYYSKLYTVYDRQLHLTAGFAF
jgi:hypothetical protein